MLGTCFKSGHKDAYYNTNTRRMVQDKTNERLQEFDFIKSYYTYPFNITKTIRPNRNNEDIFNLPTLLETQFHSFI